MRLVLTYAGHFNKCPQVHFHRCSLLHLLTHPVTPHVVNALICHRQALGRQTTTILFSRGRLQRAAMCLVKTAPPTKGPGFHRIQGSTAHTSLPPQMVSSSVQPFCTTHPSATHTGQALYNMYSKGPHLCTMAH